MPVLLDSAPAVVSAPPVSLVPLAETHLERVCALEVAPAQRRFVDSNLEVLAHSSIETAPCWRWVILAGSRPVGLALAVEDQPGCWWLWHLMLDYRQQRRGYGRSALALIREQAILNGALSLTLTVTDAGPGSPLNFYTRSGFQLRGYDSQEHLVLEMDLPASPTPTLDALASLLASCATLAAGMGRLAVTLLRLPRIRRQARWVTSRRPEERGTSPAAHANSDPITDLVGERSFGIACGPSGEVEPPVRR